jgi:hypothetical protein
METAVTIPERRSNSLHQRKRPRRYWRFMPEKSAAATYARGG